MCSQEQQKLDLGFGCSMSWVGRCTMLCQVGVETLGDLLSIFRGTGFMPEPVKIRCPRGEVCLVGLCSRRISEVSADATFMTLADDTGWWRWWFHGGLHGQIEPGQVIMAVGSCAVQVPPADGQSEVCGVGCRGGGGAGYFTGGVPGDGGARVCRSRIIRPVVRRRRGWWRSFSTKRF